MSSSRVIGITGASGFIGRHLVEHFAGHGWTVRAFQRSTECPPLACVRRIEFHMPDRIPTEEFAGLDWLIHGAVQEYGAGHRDADLVNLASAKTLLRIARAEGTRVIFLSTLSAHDEAASHYGRTKLHMESLFDPDRDAVLRLGLVLGHSGGLFGRIVEALRSARAVPLPDGGRQPVQILAIDDLIRVVNRVVDHSIGGRFDVAHPEVYRIRDLYEEIMARTGANPLMVPVPLGVIGVMVRIAETLGVPCPVTSENVLGLKRMRVFDTSPTLATLGIQTSGLTESVRRLLAR